MTTREKLIKLIAILGSKEAVAARLECSVQMIKNYLDDEYKGGLGGVAIGLLYELETAERA